MSAKRDEEKKWTPQMQFSKRIARVVTVFWIVFVTALFIMLVIWQAIDALMALAGWVTTVMITMVGAYTGNSIYEKHLDKSTPAGHYSYHYLQRGDEDEESEESESLG